MTMFLELKEKLKAIYAEYGTYILPRSYVSAHFPEVQWIQLDQNYGFSRAVNEGIRRTREPYVILLNNDTQAEERFVEEMLEGIRGQCAVYQSDRGVRGFGWSRSLFDPEEA